MPTLVDLGIVERREAPPSALFRFVPEHVASRAITALTRSRLSVRSWTRPASLRRTLGRASSFCPPEAPAHIAGYRGPSSSRTGNRERPRPDPRRPGWPTRSARRCGLRIEAVGRRTASISGSMCTTQGYLNVEQSAGRDALGPGLGERLTLNRVEPPRARHALELALAAVSEGDPRPGHEIDDGS